MENNIIKTIKTVDVIIAVGSVDGVACAAAVRRLAGKDSNPEIIFTQAFQVDKIDPTTWSENSQVVLVDLAVNNRDASMTAGFVTRVYDAGHTITAIIDEHDADAWREVMGERFATLTIQPISAQNSDLKSASALLLSVLGDEADVHMRRLLEDGNAGDAMNFETHFGKPINEAVKSDIANNVRRVYLARHFAFIGDADETIRGWMAEYQEILANHQVIIEQAIDLGDGFVRVTTGDMRIDMTTLMRSLYANYRVVVLEGIMFDPTIKDKTTLVSIATGDNTRDLVAAVQNAGIAIHGGKGSKVNLAPEDEHVALKVVRDLFNQ